VGRIERGFGEVSQAKAPSASSKIPPALVQRSSLKRSPLNNGPLQPSGVKRLSFANALAVAVDTCKCKGHIEVRYG
jgi:hypothetical protein